LVFTSSNIVTDVVLELESLFYLTIISCYSAEHTHTLTWQSAGEK